MSLKSQAANNKVRINEEAQAGAGMKDCNEDGKLINSSSSRNSKEDEKISTNSLDRHQKDDTKQRILSKIDRKGKNCNKIIEHTKCSNIYNPILMSAKLL